MEPESPPPPWPLPERPALTFARPTMMRAYTRAMTTGQHGHAGHEHHDLPTSGRALTNVAVSATLHCLTGCALGEIAGMAVGTALGFSNWGTVALAVALAFLFGYGLTS